MRAKNSTWYRLAKAFDLPSLIIQARQYFKRDTTGSEPTRKIRTVLATTAKMAPPQTSATVHAAAVGPPATNPATAPEPSPMYVSSMYTYVPIIPDPKPDNIERHFKHPTITTIENEPDYKQMYIVHK